MSKILVAEDSPDVRALIEMLLHASGHEVVGVTDGRAAVEAARTARPDLILMDLSLPILSGWEATRQIRSDPSTASIPILAVTAHAMQGDRERALAAGCDGFIPKPIDEASFGSRVTTFLADCRPPPRELPDRARSLDVHSGRVLVVDDHEEVAHLLENDLRADGHEVVVVTSAREVSELVGEDHRFDLAVIDVMLGGESGYTLTEHLTTRSSDYIPVLLITAGTIDREKGYAAGADDFIGKPIDTAELRARARSLIRVGRAVREQRRIGRERSEAYEKLAELDRLKSDFLSTVSHELRTPLNTIILLAHQLEKPPHSSEEEARRIRDTRLLRDAAEALRQMIDNILDLAKLEAGQGRFLHPQRVVLREFLRETADLLEPQARAKGLDLSIDAPPDLPETASLDREKLSRVLVNLLSNAVKYTQNGRVVLRAYPWQDSLTWEVEDTGYGIPADLIAMVFEPFRQIRPQSGKEPRGTGLGLTISKQLVEAMGGDLLVDSQEGRGTRVRFTLPQLPGEDSSTSLAEGPEGEVAEHGGGTRRVRVLVIEDDQASRYGLAGLLRSEGYEVREAATLREAQGSLDQSRPDAVILDITLPDGDGAVWLTQKAEKGETLDPVLVLTGVTGDEDTRRIAGTGVRAVLTKPVNVARLLKALRDATNGA